MEKYTIFDFGLLHLEWTNALFVLVVFSICAFLMNKLLFQPIIQTINNREQNINSGAEEIDKLQGDIEDSKQQIYDLKSDSQQKVANYREQQLKIAKQENDQILQDVRKKLDQKSEQFRADLKSEFQKIEKDIEKFSDKIVLQIKQKI